MEGSPYILLMSQETFFSNEFREQVGYPQDDWYHWFLGRFPREKYSSWTEFREKHIRSETEFQLKELERRGCKFILIAPGSKRPIAKWKKKSWTVEQCLEWIRKSHGNLAVVSKRSGIFVTDLDPEVHVQYWDGKTIEVDPFSPEGKVRWLSKNKRRWLKYLKSGFGVKTPRGGHVWFKNDIEPWPDWFVDVMKRLTTSSDIFRRGNQYELIPPSVITQEAIDKENGRLKRLGLKPVSWKEGSYSYRHFINEPFPLSQVMADLR